MQVSLVVKYKNISFHELNIIFNNKIKHDPYSAKNAFLVKNALVSMEIMRK